MLRLITICIAVSVMIAGTAAARPRHAINPTPFSHAPCSVLDARPCTPSFCSVFNHGPCIPEIDYPIGENLQVTIESVPSPGDAARYQRPDHDLDSIGDLFAQLRSCWSPPPAESAREGTQVSVRFSFKRSGEMIATPRLTYASPGISPDTREPLFQGDPGVAGRLPAAEIHRRAWRRAGRAAYRDPLRGQSPTGPAAGQTLSVRRSWPGLTRQSICKTVRSGMGRARPWQRTGAQARGIAHGTSGDDRRARPAARRSCLHHPAPEPCAGRGIRRRGQLQDRLFADIARGPGADRLGFFDVSRRRVDRRLVSAQRPSST